MDSEIREVLNLLGGPVMRYAPEIAVKEYEERVQRASFMLRKVLTDYLNAWEELPEEKKIDWKAGRTIRAESIEEDIGFNKALSLCRPILAKYKLELEERSREILKLKKERDYWKDRTENSWKREDETGTSLTNKYIENRKLKKEL